MAMWAFVPVAAIAWVRGNSVTKPSCKEPASGIWGPLAVGALIGGVLAAGPCRASDLVNGEAIFDAHCVSCHAGGGNKIYPQQSLGRSALERNGKFSVEAIQQQVTNGQAPMPSFAKLGARNVEDVASFVYAEAEVNWKDKKLLGGQARKFSQFLDSLWSPILWGPFNMEPFEVGSLVLALLNPKAPLESGAFFPRRHFCSLVLPASSATGGVLLFLGGEKLAGGWRCNDIWRLTLAKHAWRACEWKLISAHDEGQSDDRGRRWHRKWKPRCNFAAACASARRGYLLYVAGGEDAVGYRLNDVWASQDGGLSWRCMSQASPWKPRTSPSLLAVPGRAERLVLSGGMAAAAEVCQDLWISDDAGFSWRQLQQPSWAEYTGRFRAALLPLEAKQRGLTDTVQVLILGGCFIDGGEGGYGGFERLMHDAWEGKVDFHQQASEWKCWGMQTNQRGRQWARQGVDAASCTWERGKRLLALLPGQDVVSTAPLRAPDVESLPWRPAQAAGVVREALRRDLGRSISASDSAAQCHVRLSTARNAVPRLILAFDEGVLVSGFGEWRRQWRFLLLVGIRLSHLLPFDLWQRRVVLAILPRDARTQSSLPAGMPKVECS
ncbi:unnamed protein product [Effrenium voratum]|nr:unnamed protein product [Effrenium voratum]